MLSAFDVSGSKVPFHHVFQKHVLWFAGDGGSKCNLAVPKLPKDIPKAVYIGLAVIDFTVEDFGG